MKTKNEDNRHKLLKNNSVGYLKQFKIRLMRLSVILVVGILLYTLRLILD